MTGPEKLRERLAKPEIVVIPGGGSPLEIKLIEQQGFDAAFVSGYATAAFRYAVPDIGLIAFGEIEEMVRATRAVTDLPLLVDCDTGYGDVANVARTVRGMERHGVAAIQIEDQTWPKKCGHMDGKLVEPLDVAQRKIAAAVAARQQGTLIIARTDSRGPNGLNDALMRCRRFRDAGADILFIDGPQSAEELKIIGAELKGPVMVNMSESGKTPLRSAAELRALGFKIALFPSSLVRVAVKAFSAFLAELRKTGDSRPWLDRMSTLAETNTVLGLDEVKAFDAALLRKAAE